MKYPKLIYYSSLVILVLVFHSCKQKTNKRTPKLSLKQATVISSQDTDKVIYDSALILFNDTAYRLNIKRDFGDEGKGNVILTLKQTQNGKTLILTKDSLDTQNGGYVQFADFNNDGVKDLLVFYSDGARANPRFHLYLINNKLHRLIPVKGFEELTNAEFDSKSNIITSLGLSGTDYYSFYR